ncbi:MAG: hypothetical protein Q9203_003197 [Teloschistes exilis]
MVASQFSMMITTPVVYWIIYFCGHFDSPSTNSFSSASGQGPHDFNNRTVGATFSFADRNVTSRVGVLWISIAKACQFVDDKITTGSTIDDLAAAAKDNWNAQIFSNIKAETKDSEKLGLFYSSLYGMNLMPSNRTGENPLWESSEPYYDDIVTLWDLFRSATPLIQILQPVAYEEQIRSMIDIWRHDGYMPDGRSSNFNGRTQGGSNADNVLADAYVKDVVGGIDWSDGYRAMVKNAEVPPPNNHVDPAARDSSDKEGRGALPDWLALHYVSTKYSRSVTRAVEYSANDFALYQVAKGMDMTEDAAKYLNRSRNWRNHWNPAVTALRFSGFVMPRHEDGSFVNQDPLSCGGCYWPNAYYEALPWEYTFNPVHDMATLIDYMGGTEQFINRLNVTFEPNKGPKGRTVAFGNTIFDPTNEVSFLTPYLYHYAGRQDLSVKTARNLAEKNYKPGKSGLPGNSDSGAMQSWLLWNMAGLYPVTGQTTFLIGSPWFGMTIDRGEGKTLKITTNQGGNDTAIYVQSLRINGRKWNKNWLQWNDVFANGGTLDFDLAEEPSGWSLDGELPPSPASERQSLDPCHVNFF